ncbi:MFS transporter [Coprothermobacter platensis]|uniref:MFS transporter n=1 Tax=Coprothermobacter platensis TaxID=108819 RepID=UPI000374D4C0|nr:MFS transporter [Coprothermobacter platensis]
MGNSWTDRLYKTFPALKYRNFRLFWFGQAISLVGTWTQNVGQGWLVLELTNNSAYKLGIVTMLQTLPILLFSLFAGAFVERFPKRNVLLVTQTCFGILAAILATLTITGVVQYWHVLLLATLLGVTNTFDVPARQSLYAEIVEKEDLTAAIAMNSMVFNLARIIGPTVAAFLIATLGIALCFYLNALSFVAVIVGLYMMDISHIHLQRSNRKALEDIVEGLKYVQTRPSIVFPLIMMGMLSMLAMNFNILVPTLAKVQLNIGVTGYGTLMSFMGVGAFLISIYLSSRASSRKTSQLYWFGAYGLSSTLIALGLSKSVLLAELFLLLAGACMQSFNTMSNTTIQVNSEDQFRGRVMSLYSLMFNGVTPFGSYISGWLAQNLGVNWAFTISGMLSLVFVVIISLLWSASLRRQPT